jgi:hypothetical protein
MNEIFELAAQRRHLWTGWGWARRCGSQGPDGVTVAAFGARLTSELDILAAEFSRGSFTWGPTGTKTTNTHAHSVRDRVAAGAIRSAMRELETKGCVTWTR